MSTRAAETRSAKPAATAWNRPAKPASTTVEHNDRPCHENKITDGWVFPPDLSHELRYTSASAKPTSTIPSQCKNRSNERKAHPVICADFRDSPGSLAARNLVTSPADNSPQRSISPRQRTFSTNGRTQWQ